MSCSLTVLSSHATDWAAIEALTDDQIAAAVTDDPDAAPTLVYATPGLTPIVNVKKLREHLALTQEAFAAAYRIPIGTLRDWEQSRKLPDAPISPSSPATREP